MLAPHRGRKLRASLDSPHSSNEDPAPNAIVLSSSTELFYFYGQILEQCSKLFTGKPLYDLSALMRKWLKIYAEDVLLSSLKRWAIDYNSVLGCLTMLNYEQKCNAAQKINRHSF